MVEAGNILYQNFKTINSNNGLCRERPREISGLVENESSDSHKALVFKDLRG